MIEKSQQRRGESARRAEEIAARTVNRDRRREGRTPKTRSSGTGNPNTPFEARTKVELYNLAAERGVDGRSKMTKAELVTALRDQ